MSAEIFATPSPPPARLQAVTTVQVGSQASGTISALYADFNSVVKKGQVVAQLDPSVAKAQVDQSRANLEQARASLQQARAAVANSRAGVSDAQAKAIAARSTVQNSVRQAFQAPRQILPYLRRSRTMRLVFLKQQESLVQSGVIAQRELDIAKTSYRTAQARYDQAVAQLNQAKLSDAISVRFPASPNRRRKWSSRRPRYNSRRRRCSRLRRKCNRPKRHCISRK